MPAAASWARDDVGPVGTRARHWTNNHCRDARNNEFGTGRGMVGVSRGDGRAVMKESYGSREA